MGHLINIYANYWFHCHMCLDHSCPRFLHSFVSMSQWMLANFLTLFIDHKSGSKNPMIFPPSTKTNGFIFQYYFLSRSCTLYHAKNLGTPFLCFIKGLSPIIYSNELGGCPWKQLTTILQTTFLSINNTNESYIKETTYFGNVI